MKTLLLSLMIFGIVALTAQAGETTGVQYADPLDLPVVLNNSGGAGISVGVQVQPATGSSSSGKRQSGGGRLVPASFDTIAEGPLAAGSGQAVPSEASGPQAKKMLAAPNLCDGGYHFYRGLNAKAPAMTAVAARVPWVFMSATTVIGSVSRGPELYVVKGNSAVAYFGRGVEVAPQSFIFTRSGAFSQCHLDAFKKAGTSIRHYSPLKTDTAYLVFGRVSQPNGQAGQVALQVNCGFNEKLASMMAACEK